MTDKKTTEKKKRNRNCCNLYRRTNSSSRRNKRRTCKRKEKGEIVTIVNETDIQIGERDTQIVKNHRDAFDPERLGERFSECISAL